MQADFDRSAGGDIEVELTKDVMNAIQRFREHFGDIVPLQEIPGRTSAAELIDAIDRSIGKNQNLLPAIFGYGKLEQDQSKDI